MQQFIIYNYQFQKVLDDGELDLFETYEERKKRIDSNFEKKQKIFSDLLYSDANAGGKRIVFKAKNSQKDYLHLFAVNPSDDFFVLRIANKQVKMLTNNKLQQVYAQDFPFSTVIIDNRKGIQRILIEDKKSAFRDVRTIERILEDTFGRYLNSYGLRIVLMHLQNAEDFWKYVENDVQFPQGVYRLRFILPTINLDRLASSMEEVMRVIRKSFGGTLECQFTAEAGGRVHIDRNDKVQYEFIRIMMEEFGSDNIILFSNTNKRRPIKIGSNSFKTVNIDSTLIDNISDSSGSKGLFTDSAIEELKKITLTGIDEKDIKIL